MQCLLGGRKAVRAALAALTLAASAACSDSPTDKAGPTATVATEPAPTTTTDPYAVPAVIDVAYVNTVLAGLDAAVGDVTRLIVTSRTIPTEAYDRMRSLYNDDHWLQLRLDSFQADMRRDFAGYNSDPGNPRTTVTELITARNSCVFARVKRDYSAVGPGATASSDKYWVALRPLNLNRDPNGYNETRWSLAYDGFPPDRSQPPDPCVS